MSTAPVKIDPRLVTALAFARWEREMRENGRVGGFVASWRAADRGVRDRYRAECEAQIRRTFGRLLVWM